MNSQETWWLCRLCRVSEACRKRTNTRWYKENLYDVIYFLGTSPPLLLNKFVPFFVLSSSLRCVRQTLIFVLPLDDKFLCSSPGPVTFWSTFMFWLTFFEPTSYYLVYHRCPVILFSDQLLCNGPFPVSDLNLFIFFQGEWESECPFFNSFALPKQHQPLQSRAISYLSVFMWKCFMSPSVAI